MSGMIVADENPEISPIENNVFDMSTESVYAELGTNDKSSSKNSSLSSPVQIVIFDKKTANARKKEEKNKAASKILEPIAPLYLKQIQAVADVGVLTVLHESKAMKEESQLEALANALNGIPGHTDSKSTIRQLRNETAEPYNRLYDENGFNLNPENKITIQCYSCIRSTTSGDVQFGWNWQTIGGKVIATEMS